MDSNGNQRKRGRRLNKNVSVNEPSSPSNDNEVTEVSAVAISPTLEEVESSTNVRPATECRRSSRKKIIKFDVRDLLNKNRKTHKIQIEARIDSNAPSTSKANTNRGAETMTAASSSTVREDMLSKQKTFLEKSAIFRRYSISQEHKPPPPLPIPPLLGKGNDNKETILSATSTTRRLSRTQEFFSNAMIKPKQTTSLIVAQIESNTPSTTAAAKRKNLNKSLETEVKLKQIEVLPIAQQQKKRGRPTRVKIKASSNTTLEDATKTSKKLTPEKAKNWKEYKACLAQQHCQTTESRQTDDNNDQISPGPPILHNEDNNAIEQSTVNTSVEPQKEEKIVSFEPHQLSSKEHHEKSEKAAQEETSETEQQSAISQYKDDTTHVRGKESNKDVKDKNKIEKLEKFDKQGKTISKPALEDDSAKSINKNKSFEYLQKDSEINQEKGLAESKKLINKVHDIADLQRCTVEEDTPKDDEFKLTGLASKEIEKPECSSKQIVRHCLDAAKSDEETKVIELVTEIEDKHEEKMGKETGYSSEKYEETEMGATENLKAQSSKELSTSKLNPKLLSLQATTVSQHSISTEETRKTFSRTSSSSESENASDRSSSSSAPSSSTSLSSPSSRSYKSADKLRVSVKRISLPKSPSTSSQTSTSEELHANLTRKKPPIAKRSKRLQNKFVGKLKDQTTCERTEMSIANEKCETTSMSSSNMESVLSDSLSKDLQKENSVEMELKSGTITSNSPVSSDQSTKDEEALVKVNTKPMAIVSKRKSFRNRRANNSDSNDSDSGKQESGDVVTEIQQFKGKLQEKYQELKTEDTITENRDKLKKKSFEIEYINVREDNECKNSEDEAQEASSTTETKQLHRKFKKQSLMGEEDENSKNIEKPENEDDTLQNPINETIAKESLKLQEKLTDIKEISTSKSVCTDTSSKEGNKSLEFSENNVLYCNENKTLESMQLSKELNNEIEENNAKERNKSSTDRQTESHAASTKNLEVQTSESINKSNNLEKENLSLAKRKSLRKQKDKKVSESNIHDDTVTIIESNTTTSLKDYSEFQQNLNIEENIKLLSKRKGRKSRFKNLHGPDVVESETDSSTGKQTPIAEVILLKANDDKVKPKTRESIEKDEQSAETIDAEEQKLKPDIEKTLIREEEEGITENILNCEENPNESEKNAIEIAEIENVTDEYTSSSNFLSSQIQNVSIETNTLLDILRTVQSNTEAALKASKPTIKSKILDKDATELNKKYTNLVITDQELQITQEDRSFTDLTAIAVSTTKNENIDNITQEDKTLSDSKSDVVDLKTKFESLDNTAQEDKSPIDLKADEMKTEIKNENIDITAQDLHITQSEKLLKSAFTDGGSDAKNENLNNNTQELQVEQADKPVKELKTAETESKNHASPKRSEAESPLTPKGNHFSPTHSESASPLINKKSKYSPTRSASSSPLTLKKVTRRYERRSRRGDDTTHKTLEETFAEIAAQSSKAVLAAREIDIEESTVDTNLLNVEEAQIIGDTLEIELPLEDKPVNQVENLQDDVAKTLENVKYGPNEYETGQTDQKSNVSETKNTENNLEPQEPTRTTPVKRGRKPKNRSQDILTPVSKDIELKITPKAQKETLKEDEQKLIETENEDKVKKNTTEDVQSSTEGREIVEDLKIENKSIPEADEDNKKCEYASNLSKEQTNTLNVAIETAANDNKSSKKYHKKRDTIKEITEVVTEPSLALTEMSKDNEENVCTTPKQSTKKRDSSQTKSETKTNAQKKITKKTKNNEESQTLCQKDEPATTPPTSKRGRKPKNNQETPPSTTSAKKKSKKDVTTDTKEEDAVEMQEKLSDLENDLKDASFDKTLDEKLAKKKRQKKLKEAFEAALAEDIEKAKESSTAISTPCSSSFDLTALNKSPQSPAGSPSSIKDLASESTKITCITPVVTEEDPDPLKDIEKFIADGVNLLKKDYKLDEDSVGDVITSTTEKINETVPDGKTNDVDIKTIINTFETPADTPINTPCVTPPPKSPTSLESSTPDENSGVRRSHRIKLITKTPKALVGRGLVRDKERLSIKDDVETKSHYTMDDHLTGLAEVEAKNAKFLKEMEERLSNFQVIKENEYLCERVISREAKKMICDCFLTQEEEERGELGCGEDCLNRLLMIECGPDCNVKDRCTNKRFQKLLCSPCRVFRTEKKGFGIMADIEILPGEFIMEYVGEVINTEEFEKRRIMYSQDKNRHYYFMALRSDAIIDATIKGNISRFINHSCDPNAETQKWTVNGELRIGFFSRKSILPGEEITFNYQYQRYGREAQRCYCESANCRGWIGQEPTSDEGEQIDDDDESEDDEEEEEDADTSNLLVQDDEEDSDASVADPEEVQKRLEMAAAQAEVELAPIQLLEEKDKKEKSTPAEEKTASDSNKTENEEDSKSKFKKLLSKMAEKVAAKQKQTKREQKLQRKKKSKESSADLTNKLKFLEDPDIEDEVEFLKECGLKNQSDTLRLSRLMVRAKLVQTRLNLLEILRKGDFPCRRLFLDYHGLRLLHGWMSEDAGNMQIRLALLQTLETLPIANKTILTDSKVMHMVRNWCGNNTSLSPNEDSSSSNSNSQDVPAQTSANFEEGSDLVELQKLALKLVTTWEGLPEIFRIPKKERIEQMKEHEREADRQYAANAETSESTAATDRYRRNRFGRVGFNTFNSTSNRFLKPNNGNPLRTTITKPENIQNLSKAQRREMFAAKVARDEAEKRLAEERREFETKCRFFGLDPKKTRLQDVPFCVNPATGQWFSIDRKPINTPPSYAHVQVPVKPKSTDPKDYQLPAVCSTLPPQWKYAITPQGKIYYYHIKQRVPQWEPPSAAQLQLCENEDDDSESEFTTTAGEESSDDDDILIGMDAAQLKAYIDRKVEARRQKRYQRLVDERAISPRREEDRIYNQIEVRKYKENKEKIRKRKEEIRRRRAEALRQSSLNMCTLGSLTETMPPNASKTQTESDEGIGALPIQDYLLSSDEDDDIKAEVNSPLIDKIVEGDKIVDELDALTTNRQLKRPLPPHRELNEPCTSSALTPGLNPTIARLEYKKRKLEKKEKRKPKEQDAKYRKTKEKFRCEIAGIIVHYLKPYLKDTCTVGRIKSNEDFNHLARKLTHFVMIKELKYCESVGQTLVVTESVKSKSREFIKKYMAKYGDTYVKPANDPEFKDIPFTL